MCFWFVFIDQFKTAPRGVLEVERERRGGAQVDVENRECPEPARSTARAPEAKGTARAPEPTGAPPSTGAARR